MKRLELYVSRVIRGEQLGVLAGVVRVVLYILSMGYGVAVFVRNKFYDWRWLRQHEVPIPVISIGNISAGGTGKTPVTQWIARKIPSSIRVAILTRGYRSEGERLGVVQILNSEAPPAPESCGDEALLHLQELPDALHVSGVDRILAVERAEAAGAQVALLDDAMQHRRLARDLNIVVMDSTDPWAQGYLLPRGFLREPPSALERADLIVLTHVSDPVEAQQLKQELAAYSTAPVIFTCLTVKGVVFEDGHQAPNLQGKRVAVLCGIGNPQRFRQTVRDLGGDIVDELILADHTSLSPTELERFMEAAKGKGADMLICTKKDYIKLQSGQRQLRLGWVSIAVDSVGDCRALDDALASLFT